MCKGKTTEVANIIWCRGDFNFTFARFFTFKKSQRYLLNEVSNRARNWQRYDMGRNNNLKFEEGVDS